MMEHDPVEPMQPPPDAPRLARLCDLLDLYLAEAEAAHAAYAGGRPRGPTTGLRARDGELGGALEPGLHAVHAGPAAGKTALCLQAAAECPFPALYVSCEMSPVELLRWVIARATATPLGRLRGGELPPDRAAALAERAVAAAPRLVLADATRAFAAPEWLREAAEAVRGAAGGLLLVVDSLHSWADAAPGEAPEYERLNAGLAALRALSGVLACPILVIAERNRAGMRAGGMSAGAGTRKIEYGASSVLELDRDPDAPADAAGEVPVTLVLSKNRAGSAGRRIPLRFHGAFQRFREAT
jgi:replicative DNA helicase